MRTSRISKDTSSLINASALPPVRSTRISLSRFAHNMAPKEEEETPIDIEDSVPGPRKRKREVVVRSTDNLSVRKTIKVETEIEERGPLSLAKGRKALRPTRQVKKEDVGEADEQNPLSSVKERKLRKPARQVKNEDTGEVEIHPPNDWAEVYEVVKEMRTQGSAQNAAVDTMGCERLAQADVPPKVKRFHTLIALMLSSQTKDTTNAGAMNRLFTELPPHAPGAPGGLNLENILAVDPKLLNELIWAVGFHNNKTKYIKATAEILRDTWNSDIPDTIEGLMSLPGVGPKMGYLCLSAAWGRTEGIGVDVHVHRITNLWGWNKTKGPEDTRLALQAWLPMDKWHEINWLLVGLGQTICLPVGRKCGDCELGLRGLCKSAERGKVAMGRKMKAEKIKTDEDGNVLEKVETIKLEQISQDIPVNAAPMQGHPRVKEEAVEAKDSILEGGFGNSSQSAVIETSRYF